MGVLPARANAASQSKLRFTPKVFLTLVQISAVFIFVINVRSRTVDDSNEAEDLNQIQKRGQVAALLLLIEANKEPRFQARR